MRIKTLSLALAGLLAFSAAPAHAFFEANVAAGYTTLSMGELNDVISKSIGVDTRTPINSGIYLSLDAGVPLFPALKLSPRVVYVQAAQGGIKNAGMATTYDANLVPLELGLTTDVSFPLTGLSARAGVWAGYGMATFTHATKTNGVLTGSGLYQGGAFTAEALAAIRYGFLPFLSLSLEAGYRMANIAKLTDGNNELKKNATDPMPIDFSGVNLGGGLTFSF